MKHSISSVAFSFVVVAFFYATPKTADAQTAPTQAANTQPARILSNMTSDEIMEAIRNAPPFDEAKARLEVRNEIVERNNSDFNARLRLWEEQTLYNRDEGSAGPRPVKPDADLSQVEPRVQALRAQYQATLDQAALMAFNKRADEGIASNEQRDQTWRNAANAAIGRLTQMALSKVIAQSNYEGLLQQAIREIYEVRLSNPVPSVITTPTADAYLTQIESVRGYAAANPATCVGNPSSCGIVNTYTTIAEVMLIGQQAAQAQTAQEQTIQFQGMVYEDMRLIVDYPPAGQTLVMRYGYTMDSEGIVRDKDGTPVVKVGKDGIVSRANLEWGYYKLASDSVLNFFVTGTARMQRVASGSNTPPTANSNSASSANSLNGISTSLGALNSVGTSSAGAGTSQQAAHVSNSSNGRSTNYYGGDGNRDLTDTLKAIP